MSCVSFGGRAWLERLRAAADESKITLPLDSLGAKSDDLNATRVFEGAIPPEYQGVDIGPKTIAMYAERIGTAGTVIWNGPVGVFEFDQFAGGTARIARAIAESKAFSIAGGGDTLAAIAKFGIADKVSYMSTGGGAFLEFLEGKKLPAVDILEQRASARS